MIICTKRTLAVLDMTTRAVWIEPGQELFGDLARAAVADGWATDKTAAVVPPPAKTKSLKGAPENK